jgi:hypothetical protein
MAREAAAADPQKAEIMGRIRAAAMPAVMKLQRFVGELG